MADNRIKGFLIKGEVVKVDYNGGLEGQPTIPQKVSDLQDSSEYLTTASTEVKNIVKKVNNNTPDENGNVTIDIPSEVTESTVSGWGFTKNEGTVKKVNNNEPDGDGNVTIDIPSEVTESTVSGWGFTKTQPYDDTALSNRVKAIEDELAAAINFEAQTY